MNEDPCGETRLIADLGKVKAAKNINDYVNHYITVMDTKASAFLAGNVAAATFLLRDIPDMGWLRVAYVLALMLFAGSIAVAGAVIFPRLPSKGNSIIFWGDIAAHTDPQSYIRDFNRVVDQALLDEQYCMQNFFAARVLRRKYRCLRWAIGLFFCALVMAFGVYLWLPHKS